MKIIPNIAVTGMLLVTILSGSCKEKEDLPLPVVETVMATNITSSTAESGGNVTDDGGAEVYSKGICWDITRKPNLENGDLTNDGSGLGDFTSFMEGLTSGTTYYVRAYASNINGTAYGNQVSFETKTPGEIIFNPDLTYGTLNDIDGNVYKTIQIGTQTWMAENLRTTKLNSGTPIKIVSSAETWISMTTPGYCWFNNDSNYKNSYGALYDWNTVNTAKLCPTGWHVPLYDDWNTLISALGGLSEAGMKLKETGASHWISYQYSVGNNESGFTALPGSSRSGFDGQFSCCPEYICYFWSSTNVGEDYARGFMMEYNNDHVVEGTFIKKFGFSVRCVKD